MSDNAIERRHLLRNAGMVAGGAAAVTGLGAPAMPAAADDDHGHRARRLLGSWLADVRNADGMMTVSVGSFAAGGVAIIHDISPAGPPFTGSWEMRDHDSWKATVWSGFPGDDGPGSVGATIRIRLRGTVARQQLRGTFVVAVFAPDGTQVDDGSGTFRGRRIDA